ncbi:MAG: transcription termination/antitermination protein NusG [Christensenellaceae bacterium]|jgi:transcriptional antiterminator NusG|nr:transcription termination/antitermination protein NusG [Christensenellaceae bacterium]
MEKDIKNLDEAAKWYVLHTYSNYEVVAKDNLEKVIKKEGLEDRIFEIFIPQEDTVVEKRGQKVLMPNKTMPSYMFVKMIYGDDIWHTITRTNGITGFVGPKGRPLPLSTKEVNDLKLEKKVNHIVTRVEVGDTVHVVDGNLAGQTAVVTQVNASAGKCTIEVTMFGRPTFVDLELFMIKKI